MHHFQDKEEEEALSPEETFDVLRGNQQKGKKNNNTHPPVREALASETNGFALRIALLLRLLRLLRLRLVVIVVMVVSLVAGAVKSGAGCPSLIVMVVSCYCLIAASGPPAAQLTGPGNACPPFGRGLP